MYLTHQLLTVPRHTYSTAEAGYNMNLPKAVGVCKSYNEHFTAKMK